jgi:hypothetical protein
LDSGSEQSNDATHQDIDDKSFDNHGSGKKYILKGEYEGEIETDNKSEIDISFTESFAFLFESHFYIYFGEKIDCQEYSSVE